MAIFKLDQIRIFCDFLNILIDFLDKRKQRVVLNGQISAWVSVNPGVPQGSILSLVPIAAISSITHLRCRR